MQFFFFITPGGSLAHPCQAQGGKGDPGRPPLVRPWYLYLYLWLPLPIFVDISTYICGYLYLYLWIPLPILVDTSTYICEYLYLYLWIPVPIFVNTSTYICGYLYLYLWIPLPIFVDTSTYSLFHYANKFANLEFAELTFKKCGPHPPPLVNPASSYLLYVWALFNTPLKLGGDMKWNDNKHSLSF